MTSAKCSWRLRDFVPEYHHAKFGCNWTTNKEETEGINCTMCPPAYMVPKYPSLNRVKAVFNSTSQQKVTIIEVLKEF